MCDKSGDLESLVEIKKCMDSHGIGCVIMRDHVAVSLPSGVGGESGEIRRVRSCAEAHRLLEYVSGSNG